MDRTGGAGAQAGAADNGSERIGALLVFLSALCWSFGGTISRYIGVDDSWTVVFWRSLWASAFLLGFLLWRDGLRGTRDLFRAMGWPGLFVAGCFAICSTAFVVALAHTTVANVMLMNAGVPLFAALISWVVFRDKVSPPTWFAIAGPATHSTIAAITPLGDGLALLVAIIFACATVATRRYSQVRMTPANCLGTAIAGVFAFTLSGSIAVGQVNMALLFAFGALNLGLGLAFFASGARLVPAAYAALIGVCEPLLGPVWVWLMHGEVPSNRTIIGGFLIFAALLVHVALEFRLGRGPQRPGITGMPNPQ